MIVDGLLNTVPKSESDMIVLTYWSHVSLCYFWLQGDPKIGTLLYALTSSALTLWNIDRFSNFFHWPNQENICNNTVTKDPTSP